MPESEKLLLELNQNSKKSLTCIGENTNDQLVAIRQKKKVMSWSEKGSNALAIIKSLEVNK